MVTLRIAETFTSLQGEGHLAGKVTHFIRFGGCSVVECGLHPATRARWGACDTAWYGHEARNIDELATEARDAVGRDGWVCITGGEPMDQAADLRILVTELKRRGLLVSMQTSGTRVVTIPWDWLAVSPKGELRQDFGQELKVVYHGQPDDELAALFSRTRFWNYYLMPLWADGKANVDETVETVRRLYRTGQPWELTTQAHKAWGVP